jgi:TolB protein
VKQGGEWPRLQGVRTNAVYHGAVFLSTGTKFVRTDAVHHGVVFLSLRTKFVRALPVLLLLLCLPLFAVPQGQIDTGISRTGTPAVRLAVVEFQAPVPGEKGERLRRVFNETLWNDLDFTGNLELASRSFYPRGVFALPSDIRPEDWKAPGVNAQYVAYGSLTLAGNRLTATGRLRDLGVEQDAIASNFSGFNEEEESARLIAHNFADRILEQLGFGKGIARTRIAFVSDRSGSKEIWVMDYDGTNTQRLTGTGTFAITPSWSPVDDSIAYTALRTQSQVEITSASGGRRSFAQAGNVVNYVPSWSPDGKSILYSSRRDGNYEIYLADADGRNPRRLTNSRGIDTSPVFNPATGRTIAFVSTRSGTPQIHTMNFDGTDVQRITEEGGDAQNPAYSPDGKLIAFAWQKSGSGVFDLFLYDTTSRRFTQLTSNAGSNERPTWAPDGKHIAFQSNRSGSTQIYAMTLDGKKVRQLTNTRGTNEGPTWSGYATP